MYTNIGRKLMGMAQVLGWLFLAAGLVAALVVIGDSFMTALLCLGGGGAGFLSTWALYGFGQLVDSQQSAKKDSWYCTYGALNRSAESACHRCSTSRRLQAELDWEALAAERDTRLEQEAQEAQARQENRKKKLLKLRKILLLAGAAAGVVAALVCLLVMLVIPSDKYKQALERKAAGDYTQAAQLFYQAGNYKDARQQLEDFLIVPECVFWDEHLY